MPEEVKNEKYKNSEDHMLTEDNFSSNTVFASVDFQNYEGPARNKLITSSVAAMLGLSYSLRQNWTTSEFETAYENYLATLQTEFENYKRQIGENGKICKSEEYFLLNLSTSNGIDDSRAFNEIETFNPEKLMNQVEHRSIDSLQPTVNGDKTTDGTVGDLSPNKLEENIGDGSSESLPESHDVENPIDGPVSEMQKHPDAALKKQEEKSSPGTIDPTSGSDDVESPIDGNPREIQKHSDAALKEQEVTTSHGTTEPNPESCGNMENSIDDHPSEMQKVGRLSVRSRSIGGIADISQLQENREGVDATVSVVTSELSHDVSSLFKLESLSAIAKIIQNEWDPEMIRCVIYVLIVEWCRKNVMTSDATIHDSSQLQADEEENGANDRTASESTPKNMETQDEESTSETVCEDFSKYEHKGLTFEEEKLLAAEPDEMVENMENVIRRDGTGCIFLRPQHQGLGVSEESTDGAVGDETILASRVEIQEESSNGAGFVNVCSKSSVGVENLVPFLPEKTVSETVDVGNDSQEMQVGKEESIGGTISDKTAELCPGIAVQGKKTSARSSTETSPLQFCTDAQNTGESTRGTTTRATSKSRVEMKEQQSQYGIRSDAGTNSCSEVRRKESNDGTKTVANPKFHDGMKNPGSTRFKRRERISALIAENMRKKATKSATIGNEGGEISLYGCSVLFPKDAVKEETTFCLEVDNNPENFPPNVTTITPIMGLVPHMDFEKEVTVVMRTCYSAMSGDEIPGEIWSQEENGEWELTQKTFLEFKNQIRFKVRHFSGRATGIKPENSKVGEYNLLNHVYIQKGTAAVASVFCQDEKALQDCKIGLSEDQNYVSLMPLYEEISCKIDSTFIVEIKCKRPKNLRYESDLSPAEFVFTEDEQKKHHFWLDFVADKSPSILSREIRLFYSVTVRTVHNDDIREKTPVKRTVIRPWPIKIKKSRGPSAQAIAGTQSDIVAHSVTGPGSSHAPKNTNNNFTTTQQTGNK